MIPLSQPKTSQNVTAADLAMVGDLTEPSLELNEKDFFSVVFSVGKRYCAKFFVPVL